MKDDSVHLCAWALDQGRDGCLIEALLGQLVYASLNLAYTTLLVRHFASQNVTKDQNTLLSKKCRKKEDTLLERVLQKCRDSILAILLPKKYNLPTRRLK